MVLVFLRGPEDPDSRELLLFLRIPMINVLYMCYLRQVEFE